MASSDEEVIFDESRVVRTNSPVNEQNEVRPNPRQRRNNPRRKPHPEVEIDNDNASDDDVIEPERVPVRVPEQNREDEEARFQRELELAIQNSLNDVIEKPEEFIPIQENQAEEIDEVSKIEEINNDYNIDQEDIELQKILEASLRECSPPRAMVEPIKEVPKVVDPNDPEIIRMQEMILRNQQEIEYKKSLEKDRLKEQQKRELQKKEENQGAEKVASLERWTNATKKGETYLIRILIKDNKSITQKFNIDLPFSMIYDFLNQYSLSEKYDGDTDFDFTPGSYELVVPMKKINMDDPIRSLGGNSKINLRLL